MKERKIKIELDDIGECKMRVSNVGIHLKRGKRDMYLSWEQFFKFAVLPPSSHSKFHSSISMKKRWLIEGRKNDV